MPYYGQDFDRSTKGWPRPIKWSYMAAIWAYWCGGCGGLADSDEVLRRICECDTHEWAATKGMIFGPKFKLVDGVWHQDRSRIEYQEAIETMQSSTERGRAGAVARWSGRECSSNAQALPKHMLKQCSSISSSNAISPSPSLESRPFPEYPNWELVMAKAEMIGLATWKAKDWFDEMEGCGWLDHAKRPIQSWEAVLQRVKTKWEADGRPSGPPASKYPSKPATGSVGPSLTELNSYARNKFSHPKLAQWVASFAAYWNKREWKQNGRSVEWQEALTKQVKQWIEKENGQ